MLQTLRLDEFPENIQRLLDAGKLTRQEDRLLIPPEQDLKADKNSDCPGGPRPLLRIDAHNRLFIIPNGETDDDIPYEPSEGRNEYYFKELDAENLADRTRNVYLSVGMGKNFAKMTDVGHFWVDLQVNNHPSLQQINYMGLPQIGKAQRSLLDTIRLLSTKAKLMPSSNTYGFDHAVAIPITPHQMAVLKCDLELLGLEQMRYSFLMAPGHKNCVTFTEELLAGIGIGMDKLLGIDFKDSLLERHLPDRPRQVNEVLSAVRGNARPLATLRIHALNDRAPFLPKYNLYTLKDHQPYTTVSFYPITFKNQRRGILIEAPTTIGNKVEINGRDIIPNMNFVRDCMAEEGLFIRCGALFKDGEEITPEAPLANIIIEHTLPPGSRIIYAEAQGR